METALARARLGGAEHDDVGESQIARHVGQRRSGDKRHLDARQAAFVQPVETLERLGRDDGAQDAVAQKLQALVGILDRTPLDGGRMRHGGKQELLVREAVLQDVLRLIEFAALLVR